MTYPTAGDGGATRQELYLLVDRLRGIAALGAQFARSTYERERADQITEVAAELAALAESPAHPADARQIAEVFFDQGWPRVSPTIGVEAAVLDQDGRILLCRRADNGHWCLPGGLAEIGEALETAALRELWEEAGLRGRTVRLLGVFDGRTWGSVSKVHLVHLVYLVESDGGRPGAGVEMLDVGFFDPRDLPAPLHPGHDRRIPVCLDLIRTGGTHHDGASTLTGPLPMHQRPE